MHQKQPPANVAVSVFAVPVEADRASINKAVIMIIILLTLVIYIYLLAFILFPEDEKYNNPGFRYASIIRENSYLPFIVLRYVRAFLRASSISSTDIIFLS
jgi:hypothetical protein